MSEIPEDQIKWVTLTLDFPPESEKVLEAKAQAEGISLACCYVRLIYKDLMRTASGEEKNRLEQQLPLVLRRNGCAPAMPPG